MCRTESGKLGIKKIIQHEKQHMLPWDFRANYVVVPLYGVITLLLLVLFGVLMEIDDKKYFVHGMVCLGIFALCTIVLLSSVPLRRRKTIRAELERYDFDHSSIEGRELWDFSDDRMTLKFDRYGMDADGVRFYYSHMSRSVVTSNHYKRIWIWLEFSTPEGMLVRLPVDASVLKMLEHLKLKLDNGDVLDYIVSNKEQAFRQIYFKGFVAIPRH